MLIKEHVEKDQEPWSNQKYWAKASFRISGKEQVRTIVLEVS